MTLEELFKDLSYGVLSNLAIGGEGSGAIPYARQPKVIHAVNTALTALHTRFQIYENEVQVRAYDNLVMYPLKRIYADSDPTSVAQKFITDSVEKPFQEDVILIRAIYDEEGNEVSFNEVGATCKVFTPKNDLLQITEPVTGSTYFLIYQANHPKLVPDLEDQEVSVPFALKEAFEARVAYGIYAGMNGAEHTQKAAEYMALYENLCQMATDLDLLATSRSDDGGKFSARGFR